MAVNKVIRSDGTVLMDITPTTAVASDVAQGKYFYTANGTKTAGTATGGGSVASWETLYDNSTTIQSDDPNWATLTYNEPFLVNETYRVTWGTNGTQYICQTKAGPDSMVYDGYFIGNPSLTGQYTDTGEPFFMYRASATQLNIATNQSAGTIYIKIERQVSSSGATLVTKTIITNGTYDAEDDNADGFSSVTVNVPSANLTTKTITTNGTYRASTDNVDGYSEITVNVSSGGGGSGTPAHTIYFEYLDGTNTTISVDYSDSIVGTMITSYNPIIHNNKYVGLAQLDGVTWYSPAAIPLNTELIDYSAVSNDTDLQDDGTTLPKQWYAVSGYTMIDPTMTFSYKGLYWGRICFYDETRTFISYFSIYHNGEQEEEGSNTGIGTLTPAQIPSTAKFVRIATLNDADSDILSLIRTA